MEDSGESTQSSTVSTKRLVPSWTLSRQDMGADSTRNRALSDEKEGSNVKKKGRFVFSYLRSSVNDRSYYYLNFSFIKYFDLPEMSF